MSSIVPSVAAVNLTRHSTDPDQLHITAFARVPVVPNQSTKLVPYNYATAPENGIYEFAFMAEMPELVGMGMPDNLVVASVHLNLQQNSLVKGVKIQGASNSKVIRLPVSPAVLSLESDSFYVNTAEIREDKLIVNVQYAGGNVPHDFELAWDGVYLESFPPRTAMTLRHHDNGDAGEVLKSETLEFSLHDLEPCMIELNTPHGLQMSLPFKLSHSALPELVPLGPGGIPIIDSRVVSLLVSLLQDDNQVQSLLNDPASTIGSFGLSNEQLGQVFGRQFQNTVEGNGFGGILQGSTGILSYLRNVGVRENVLNALEAYLLGQQPA